MHHKSPKVTCMNCRITTQPLGREIHMLKRCAVCFFHRQDATVVGRMGLLTELFGFAWITVGEYSTNKSNVMLMLLTKNTQRGNVTRKYRSSIVLVLVFGG